MLKKALIFLVMLSILLATGCLSNIDDIVPTSTPVDVTAENPMPESEINDDPADISEDVSNDDMPETDPEYDDSLPIVYFTMDISPEGLMAVYESLNWTPTGNVAVKIRVRSPISSEQ